MKLDELKRKYKNRILKAAKNNRVGDIRVFGSILKNDDKNNDIDFLVKLDPKADLLDLSGLRLDLMEILKCDVDVFPENSLHWVIKDQILKEAVHL